MKPATPKQLRCAIYTRVSTDHGLEQEFNSLDNTVRHIFARYVALGSLPKLQGGMRYRYYVSAVLAQGRKAEAGSVARVAAADIERLVLDAMASRLEGQSTEPCDPIDRDRLAELVQRITLGPDRVTVLFTEAACDREDGRAIVVAWSPKTMRRGRAVIAPAADPATPMRPMRAEARSKLLQGIAQARSWLDDIMSGRVPGIEAIAAREAISERAARMTLSLAFVAPDIVEAAVEGSCRAASDCRD